MLAMSRRPRAVCGRDIAVPLLWLWVVAAFAAYLWQFQGLLGPVLAMVRGA